MIPPCPTPSWWAGLARDAATTNDERVGTDGRRKVESRPLGGTVMARISFLNLFLNSLLKKVQFHMMLLLSIKICQVKGEHYHQRVMPYRFRGLMYFLTISEKIFVRDCTYVGLHTRCCTPTEHQAQGSLVYSTVSQATLSLYIVQHR